MEEEKKKSNLLVAIFWLSSIGCFIFGYYNTVMGLSTFDAFGSSAGSWILAIIPLVMVFGGYYASVQGRKGMLALYLAGEVLFFVFNLTYLYPQYLGRTLVNEEAKALEDSISKYDGRFKDIVTEDVNTVIILRQFQTNLLDEIKHRKGFGQRASEQLEKFNKLAGSKYTPPRENPQTQEEWDKLHDRWKEKTDQAINDYIIRLNGHDEAALKLFNSKTKMAQIKSYYSPKLELVMKDNSDVSIDHHDVATNLQIGLLKDLTTKLDIVANDVNSVRKPAPFNLIVTGDETIAFPKTQKLGTFEHTMISVTERLNKLDTWGVIIICLFFDLLGPFLFYFYLRKDEEESNYVPDDDAWGDSWLKGLFVKK